MPRISYRVRAGLIGVLVTSAIWLVGCDSSPPPIGKRVGNKCPEIAGSDPDGKLVRLSDHRGKVVLVNFWGTWCRPCRALIPHEREMVKTKYAGRPFVIFGVANDAPETLKSFLKTNDLPWPNIADGSPGIICTQWNVSGFPSAVLIDQNGIIIKRWLDGINPEEVWMEVEKAVRAAEG